MSEPFTRAQVIAACRALGLDPRRVVDLRIEPRRVTVVTAEPVLPIRRVTTVHPIATDGEASKIDNGIREPQAASWQDGDLVVRVDRDESFLEDTPMTNYRKKPVIIEARQVPTSGTAAGRSLIVCLQRGDQKQWAVMIGAQQVVAHDSPPRPDAAHAAMEAHYAAAHGRDMDRALGVTRKAAR